MKLKESAINVFEKVKSIGDGLEVTFDEDEITLYWHNLRLDVQPQELDRALKIITDCISLNARFE